MNALEGFSHDRRGLWNICVGVRIFVRVFRTRAAISMNGEGSLVVRKAWRSRVEAEVRLQACVIGYSAEAGAAALTLEQFGVLFLDVLERACVYRGPGKADREEDRTGGGWMARCVGEGSQRDDKGCRTWLRFEVLVRFRHRIKLENTLSRLRLGFVDGSLWKPVVHATSPHGLAWKVWMRILVERWSYESVNGPQPIGDGFEELGVLEGLFDGCRQCVWIVEGTTPQRVGGCCEVWCWNNAGGYGVNSALPRKECDTVCGVPRTTAGVYGGGGSKAKCDEWNSVNV
jgi:hypothetical protein